MRMPSTCRIFLPPPNIPLFGQSPGLYGALAVALFCLVAGWLLYGIGLNRGAPALGRVDWNRGALVAFAAAPTPFIVAYLLWSQLEYSWYFAYHTAFIASQCDPGSVARTDQTLRLTHTALLAAALLTAGVGLFLSWRRRALARLARP